MDAGTQRRPVVGHAMRAYLAPSETFVHNQITSLTRYRPVVVAHHRRPETETPLVDGVVATEALAAPLSLLQRGGYRAARVALPAGVELLARRLRDEGARLLHYHYLTDARFLLAIARRTGLPAVASAYGYDVTLFPRQYGGLGRRYLRPVFDRLDCVLAMSEDMGDDLVAIGCPADKIRVHYHGSPTARFRHPQRRHRTDAPLTVLCCARLEPIKGQDVALEALRRLERRGRRDLRLVLVGDGSDRGRLQRIVADAGWTGERVVFAGHVPHASDALVRHFRDADVFVHPSHTIRGVKEGIPGTIVEAMAAGLPVVATRHGGIPAVIESGREGVLVGEDDPEALASALEALAADAGDRERLGRAAAERAARELDLHARTAALERIYDRLV
ncbi:MAG TPA: glycosyltransferase [Baekduia sp.]|nr:glycosyltransferase [Baekduia sp.]